jgi:hypothetical protein
MFIGMDAGQHYVNFLTMPCRIESIRLAALPKS